MKKLLSYIWPLTRKKHSDHNGVLELTLNNGKLMLDSKNTNYSYGSLQRILEKGLAGIALEKVSSTLLLGLGGGSVIKSLREKFGYSGAIDAVEIDAVVIDIARESFEIKDAENLRIIHADAQEYVQACTSDFDLIIVDLFIDNQVPSIFYSHEFCEKLLTILSKQGSLIFNLGLNTGQEDERKQVVNFFKTKSDFRSIVHEKVEGTNMLLVATSGIPS
jgi:spermidine synthase